MGKVTYRIAGNRDAFLIRTLPHGSSRLIFTCKIAFVSTLCVWNKKVDALPLRTNRKFGGYAPIYTNSRGATR